MRRIACGVSAQRPCKTAAGLSSQRAYRRRLPEQLCQNGMYGGGGLLRPFSLPLPASLISIAPLKPAAKDADKGLAAFACSAHTRTHSSTATQRVVKGNKQMSLKGSTAAVAGVASTAFPPLPSAVFSFPFLSLYWAFRLLRPLRVLSVSSPLQGGAVGFNTGKGDKLIYNQASNNLSRYLAVV